MNVAEDVLGENARNNAALPAVPPDPKSAISLVSVHPVAVRLIVSVESTPLADISTENVIKSFALVAAKLNVVEEPAGEPVDACDLTWATAIYADQAFSVVS